jgi:hypothetical protein
MKLNFHVGENQGKPGKTQIKPKINIKHYKVLISGGDNQDKKGKPK